MDIGHIAWNDAAKCYDVGTVGGEVVSIVPMLFNHRVVVGPVNDRSAYSHGWCYQDWISAVLAVLAWDPVTEVMPVGFIKQATPGLRQIPRKNEWQAVARPLP